MSRLFVQFLMISPAFCYLAYHGKLQFSFRSSSCQRLAKAARFIVRGSTSWDESPYFENTPPPTLSQDAANIIKLCAYTNRGTSASSDERIKIEQAIRTLEATNPTSEPASSSLLNGEWRLVYTPEASVTRSSPFFWAFRKALRGVEQPLPLLPRQLSEALFTVTDGIPQCTPGAAAQRISGVPSPSAKLVSSVSLTLRAFDAILPPLQGDVETTAALSPSGPATLSVTVEQTAIRRSSLARLLPDSARDAFDAAAKAQTGRALDALRSGASAATMEVTYLDDAVRVSRVDGGGPWVFVRTAADGGGR